MKLQGIRRGVALAAMPIVLSGCDLLFGGMVPWGPVPFGDPGAMGDFERGRATLLITSETGEQTVVLDEALGSMSVGFTFVTFRNDDGWSMSIDYADESNAPGPLGLDGNIMFDRMNGDELWTTGFDQSMSQCTIDVAESTRDRVSGSADCEAMRWVDALRFDDVGLTQPYVEGQPLFDVRVTFEAVPLGNSQTS